MTIVFIKFLLSRQSGGLKRKSYCLLPSFLIVMWLSFAFCQNPLRAAVCMHTCTCVHKGWTYSILSLEVKTSIAPNSGSYTDRCVKRQSYSEQVLGLGTIRMLNKGC